MKIVKSLFIGAAALAFTACDSNSNKFTVEGEITNAKDSVLYFANISLDGYQVKDSTKLTEDGKFCFKISATDAPEFYCLRIADQIINISIDSTETVTIKAKYPAMANNYTVTGSEQCKIIQELSYKQQGLLQQAIAIEKSTEISYKNGLDSIQSLINVYKDEIKKNYIFKHPEYTSSYFALFQAIGDRLIFNPRSDKEDIRVFGAVATSWESKYPESLRSKNLHNITIEGMNNIRYVEGTKARAIETLNMAEESNLIDISLTDNKGAVRNLKSLNGKVVLLDFHSFTSEDSPQRIMMLREIYNKYSSQGLEIYQISVDPDIHFWKTQTEALPWICVNDPESINSRNLLLYNVQSIPTFFLINKKNELVKRDAQIKDIDAEIRALL